MPVRFVKLEGQWKIDAIGTPEELQQQKRLSVERIHGASPRAAVEAFREAMADGRFQTALNYMTEDARNEWIGEMLISPVDDQNRVNNESRWRFSGEAPYLLDGLESLRHVGPLLSGPTSTAVERRAECIKMAGENNIRELLLRKLLWNRSRDNKLPLQFTGTLGEPRPGDVPTSLRALWTWTSPENLLPIEVDFVQIDGLWKLNTIIDPALKPWPLPAEESTPPAEATPADGATGVP